MAIAYKDIPFPDRLEPQSLLANLRTAWENFKLAKLVSQKAYYTSAIPANKTLADLVSTIDDETATIYVNSTITLSSNLTIPSNISVVRLEGGGFTSSNASTLTINGPFSSPPSQAFFGSLVVAFAIPPTLFTQWWGAKGDGSTNDSSAFQSALNVGGVICVPSGTYILSSSINAKASTRFEMSNGATLSLGGTARIIVGDDFAGDTFSISGGSITKTSATKGTFSSNNSLVSISKTSGTITEVQISGVSFESDIDSGTINKFGGAVLTRFTVKDCVFSASSSYHRKTDIYLAKPDDSTDSSAGRTVAVEINNNKFLDCGRDAGCIIIRGNSKTGYVNILGNSFTRMIYGAVELGISSATANDNVYNGNISGNSIIDSGISSTNPTTNLYGILVNGSNHIINNNIFSEFNRYDSSGTLQNASGYCWCIYIKGGNVVMSNNTLKNSGYNCVLQLKGDTGDDPSSPESYTNIMQGNVITLDSTFLSTTHPVSGSEDPAVIKVRAKGAIISNNVIRGDSANKPFRGLNINGTEFERTIINGNYLENINLAFAGSVTDVGHVTKAENNTFVNCTVAFSGASPSWKKSYDPILKNNPYTNDYLYVDADLGDDGASGQTVEQAVKTITEALRRIPEFDDNATIYTIYILKDSTQEIYIPNNCFGGKIVIQGYIGETAANTEVGYVSMSEFAQCSLELKNLIFTQVNSGNVVSLDGFGYTRITDCSIDTAGTVTYHVVATDGHILSIDGLTITSSVAGATCYGIASQYNAIVRVEGLSGSVTGGDYGFAPAYGGEIYNLDNSSFTGFSTPIFITFAGKYHSKENTTRTVESGITASTTQSQGQGALTRDINIVSAVANANDVVTLPAAALGLEIFIRNNGANTLQIFPASGDKINGGVANASVTLAAGASVTYRAQDATDWWS